MAGPLPAWIDASWRWLEPPRKLRPTRAGAIFVAAVTAVGAAAVNTGNNLLYFVLGMTLGAIVISGILSERNLRGLHVERAVPPDVEAGTPATLAYVVTARRSWLPVLGLELHDEPAPGEGGRALFVRVDPGRTRRRTYTRTFPSRGVHRVSSVVAATTFPFGLFRKSRRLDVPGEVRVRPRVRALDPAGLPGGGDEGGSRRLARGEGLELFALRDHAPGDEARRIHWKATARAGRPIVKDPARDDPPSVVVQLRLAGYPSPHAFERAVEHAASVAAALLDRGYSVGLTAGKRSLPPAAAPSQLDRILDALVDVAMGEDVPVSHAPASCVVTVGPESIAARDEEGQTPLAGAGDRRAIA